MEVVDDVAATPPPNIDLSSPIAKGKRTKRHRPHSPISFTITTPTDNNNNNNNNLLRSPSFSAASSEESTTTAEVDTARCLILLSRGHFPTHPPNDHQYSKQHNNNNNNNNNNKRSYNNINENNNNKTFGYACKTCNRVFPSFQALGGHRASHKKPKNEKKPAILSDEEDFPSPFPSPSMSSSKNRFSSNSLSLQLSNISTTTFSATPKSSPSPRIHECSYCGAEFTSGQALGGHMRKHRGGPIINRAGSFRVVDASIEEIDESKTKPKTGLSLDLNLPAPEDENNQRFGNFVSKRSPEEKDEGATTGHVLATTTPPPLVDCRY